MIAPTLPEVVDNLQHAARLAPFHRRTHELLPSGLFLLGRIPEMRAAVARLRLIAPNATSAGMWQAYIDILDDNLEAAYRECERLRPTVGDDGVVVIKMMMRTLHTMSRSEMAWEPEEKRLAILKDVLAAAPQLSQLLQDSRNPEKAARWADFAMYRLPCFKPLADHPLFKNSGKIEQLMALMQPKTMNELAVRLVDTCPNGMFLYMQSTWLYAEGRQAEAEAVLCRAIRTPSPFPVRRVALVDLTTLQFQRLAKNVSRASGGTSRTDSSEPARPRRPGHLSALCVPAPGNHCPRRRGERAGPRVQRGGGADFEGRSRGPE